jgi:PAS domain S-box-containing protein
MKSELHILHLEDSPEDAELIRAELGKLDAVCTVERTQNRPDFVAALARGGFDLILSDFAMPAFDGMAALALAREKCPTVPFLFVSGTLGEDAAIDSLKHGATDYVQKHRLPRLVPAVERALELTEERRAVCKAEEAMIQSEFKYRQLFDCLGEAALLVDASSGRVLDTNRQAETLFGRTRGEIIGQNQDRFHSPATLQEFGRRFVNPAKQSARVVFDGAILTKDGQSIPVSVSAAPILLHGRRLILGLYRDLTGHNRDVEEIRRLKDKLKRQGG